MATNERVINRSMWTTERWFADPQNVYWLINQHLCWLWIILSRNICKCTDFVPIANISEVWIERMYTPSVIHVSVGGCTVKQAIYYCYHRLISWRATFGYCQMCWLLVHIVFHVVSSVSALKITTWTRVLQTVHFVSTCSGWYHFDWQLIVTVSYSNQTVTLLY